LRIAFLGSPEFACPSLRALLHDGHEIVGAVCRPDRRSGRGLAQRAGPVAAAARELGITLHQPERVNAPDSVQTLRSLRPDLLVVVAFGALLKPELLTAAPLGAVNLHASLLPSYRGAAPIAWAIAAGETVTGVTTMHLDEEMDAGDIILQRCVMIGPEETAGELAERLSVLGAALLAETVRRLARGDAPRMPQDASRATHARRLEKEDGRLDWSFDAVTLHHRIRAMTPWPGAMTAAGGRRLLVRKARPLDLLPRPSAPVGSVLEVSREGGLIVQTGRGALVLEVVQPGDRRVMTGAEFARGARLGPGSRLGEDA
jgi:methionyl-tRNA formyltransferase